MELNILSLRINRNKTVVEAYKEVLNLDLDEATKALDKCLKVWIKDL